ncbi:MAG: hypothetical protein ACXW05_21115 [Gemmatirosa sp.]
MATGTLEHATQGVIRRATPWMRRSVSGVLLCLAALPSSAAAQPDWRAQVARYISSSGVVARLQREGFTVSHNTFYDVAMADERKTFTVNLQAGRTYRFVGKCDNDCSDLDFYLYDENRQRVDSDAASDDTPVLSVTPRRSAQFTLAVRMARCATSRCYWGVAVYSRANDGVAPNNAIATNALSSSGDEAWHDQVRNALLSSRALRAYQQQGYTESHAPHYALTTARGYTDVRYALVAGRTYQLIGKCDNDCTDLDFRLYDENSQLVASDTGADDIPMVSVAPRRSATFTLRVSMATCSTSRCGWGVVALLR